MQFSILALLAVAQLVAGHGAIIKATGDAGGAGSAIGVDAATPRDGTRRNPFQQDSTRFKGENKATCGQTLGGGENDIATGTKAVMDANGGQLPQVSAGGSIDMTLHQVNGDGAGPYSCMINADGTGADWQAIDVTTQVEGTRSNNRANAMTDLPLSAAIPAGQTCTGNVAGQQNVCMVRCQNTARAGPFGGCVPVQMVAGAGAAAPAAPATKREEDLENDPAFLAELRADGEEI
ncbi:hypothetical protein EJ08DRAFT_666844 [Tothia fuscella]|uniref:Uncharacterized protein n=1 Tax=Tothia fuscella TaxID=1048955 RepID=A0A9P4NDJ5_9PEZI|nr:hypothetical protein EJ08DRAFT_666844 [Tothia fuscella]